MHHNHSTIESSCHAAAASLRRSGIAAMLGGVLWIISSVSIAPLSTLPLPTLLGLRWLVSLALLLFGGGVLGLHARWAAMSGTLGRMGVLSATLGIVCALAGRALLYVTLSGWSGVSFAPSRALFALGVIGVCVGLVCIGAGALNAASERGWQALPLLIGLIGLFLPLGAGVTGTVGLLTWLTFGLGWIWLGVILYLEQRPLRTGVLRANM